MMRWKKTLLAVFLCFVGASLLDARDARVIKVLPHYLDADGRHTLSPSLYERDAYQVYLRKHPKERAALRFDVQWKADSKKPANLFLRVELRGVRGNTITTQTLETPVTKKSWLSQWSSLLLSGERFAAVGEMVAWRVSLWNGDGQIADQKSFLW